MDDDDLTAEERAHLASVDAVLADPALWAEPPVDLQERVVAAITAESESAPPSGRRPWVRYAVGGVAAAVLLAVGVTVGIQLSHDDGVYFAASLQGTQLAPKATGDVTLHKTPSGWRIELHATGLPRREGGEFYEAWLKDETRGLVPIGTFNDGRDVILWAGVGPADFPTLTVTREVADGNQASSGEVVLTGQPHRD
jgi:Anti-sigma-K factor rskA